MALLQTQAAQEFHGGIVGEGLDFALELGAFHAHLRGYGIDAQFGTAHLSLEDFEKTAVELAVEVGRGRGRGGRGRRC